MIHTPARTIGTQVLLWVNIAWIALAVTFLTYDYQRDLNERLREKHISLHEEAKTLMPGVLQVRRFGQEEIQAYIDAVCSQMRDSQSPGHHIVVDLGGVFIQASAHHRASPEMLNAVRDAASSPDSRSAFGADELLVGSYSRSGVSIHVSETLASMRRSVIGDVLVRLSAMFVMAMVATAIVNIGLWKIVASPIGQLVGTVKEIGKGHLGTLAGKFGSVELDFLAEEINAMSVSLAKADEERKQQMLRAREIQEGLLPESLHTPRMNAASVFLPADDVGGDYFDILEHPNGGHLLAIADVIGHGVPAAMSAAMLKVLLLQAVEQGAAPAKILAYINRNLVHTSVGGDFVSMALAWVNASVSRITYASAGHEPSLFLSASGRIHQLHATGMPLGIVEEGDWEDAALDVNDGDRLLMLTDGVSETLSPNDPLFGRSRIRDCLQEQRNAPVGDTLARITEMLRSHRRDRSQLDDVTMLMVELTDVASKAHVVQ